MPETPRVWPGRRVRRALRPRPGWVRGVVGLVLVVAGLYLGVHPLTSLDVLVLGLAAVAVALGAMRVVRADVLTQRVLGVVWIAVGVALVVWRAPAVELLGLALSVWLLVAGVLRLRQARQGAADARATAVLLGLAGIALGVVALAWPDAALVTVGIVLGLRAAFLGAVVLLDLVPRRRPAPQTARSDGPVASSGP